MYNICHNSTKLPSWHYLLLSKRLNEDMEIKHKEKMSHLYISRSLSRFRYKHVVDVIITTHSGCHVNQTQHMARYQKTSQASPNLFISKCNFSFVLWPFCSFSVWCFWGFYSYLWLQTASILTSSVSFVRASCPQFKMWEITQFSPGSHLRTGGHT